MMNASGIAARSSPNARIVVHSALRATGHSTANRHRAKHLVWKWVGSKWPRLVPPVAEMEREEIRSSAPGQELSVSCNSSADGADWTLALAHRDEKGDRTWMTRATVRDAGDADLMRVQTSCIGESTTAIVVAPPRLLGLWAEHLGLTDGGFAVQGDPRVVVDARQAEAFCEHVLSAERTLPILALLRNAESRHYGVDPRVLAAAVCGLAHVACLGAGVAEVVTERLGKDFAPARGAARVYAPGFQVPSPPADHPLIHSKQSRTADPGSFKRMLVQCVCAISAASTDRSWA